MLPDLVSHVAAMNTSVLKSGPRTGKRPATGPDHNQFGLDCSCSPGGFSIGPVAVAEG